MKHVPCPPERRRRASRQLAFRPDSRAENASSLAARSSCAAPLPPPAQPQDRCAMPPPSSHEQPVNAFFTQAHAGFFAHSGNQPQAGPPGALSSQYQPLGQRASPHGEQVPSSQLTFAAGASSLLASALSLSAVSASLSEVSELESAPSGEAAAFSEPPQPAISEKRASPRARTLRTVIRRRYPERVRPG